MGEARRKKLLYGAPTYTRKKTRFERRAEKFEKIAQEIWESSAKKLGDQPDTAWPDVSLEERESFYVLILGMLLNEEGFPGLAVEMLESEFKSPRTPGSTLEAIRTGTDPIKLDGSPAYLVKF